MQIYLYFTLSFETGNVLRGCKSLFPDICAPGACQVLAPSHEVGVPAPVHAAFVFLRKLLFLG